MCVYSQLESTREDHHLLLFRLRDMSKQTEHFIAPRETASTKNNGAQRRQPLIQVVNSSDEEVVRFQVIYPVTLVTVTR